MKEIPDTTKTSPGIHKLKVNEQLYHKMIDEVSDYAILLLDIDGTILNWNTGARNIKGYEAGEIIGHNFRKFYSAEDQKNKVPESLLKQAKAEGKISKEGWRVKKDGSKFWGSVTITALHDDQNNTIGFTKVTRDLTERKMAEELLRQSEERYHRMITEVEDYAIILLDPEGNILNWNKGAEKIKGYESGEIIGKNFREFYLEEDRKKDLPGQLLNLAAATNKATHEGWRKRKDGSLFWGSIVITALHNTEGAIIGYSKVTRDLTEKKQFEDQILMQNKQLEEYAYVASHDLQEPLRKIQTFSNLLKKDIADNEKALKNLEKINASAERMSNLIRSVLTYSRTEGGKELFMPTDLNEVVRHIEADFEVLLHEKKGRIVYSGLPVINAIPIQMHQLFSNLISNAIKFNDKAPVVSITSEPAQSPNADEHREFVKLEIADNGIGFDQEFESKMFRMFQRLHDKPGTGIGLALCKKIVENHGGTIRATSSGNGSVFEVVLPVS